MQKHLSTTPLPIEQNPPSILCPSPRTRLLGAIFLCNSTWKPVAYRGRCTDHDSTISVDRLVWSFGPLSAALPESPPPICSDCSSPPRSSATIFYYLAPTVLSISRFQSARSNFSKPSVSSNIEIEGGMGSKWQELEWLPSSHRSLFLHATFCVSMQILCSSFHFYVSLDDGIATQNCHSKYRSRQSAVADAEVHSRALSSFLDDDNEKKHDDSDPKCNYNINSSDADSVDCGNHKLMTRPKPYSDFLDEIKAQELEAQMGAWKKAKHRELMNRLRRNEAVIRDWKYKQTRKALKDMRKVENKLERKRAEALERAQKRINKARKEANKAAGKVIKSAMKKRSKIAKESEIPRHQKPNLAEAYELMSLILEITLFPVASPFYETDLFYSRVHHQI